MMPKSNSGTPFRIFRTVVACATALALAGACSSGSSEASSDDAPLEVLYVSGLTGLLSNSATTFEIGIKAHIDHLNENGGIDGRKIKFTSVDDQSDPTRAVTLVQESISSDGKPDLVIPGVSSNEGIAMAPLLSREKIVAISGGSSTELLDDVDKYPYFFSETVTLPKIMRGAAHFMSDYGGVTNVAVVAPDDALGEAIEAAATEAFEEVELTVSTFSYKSDSVDIAPTFSAALDTDPDFIFMDGAGTQAPHLLSGRAKAGAEKVPTIAGSVSSNEPLHTIGSGKELENLNLTMLPLRAYVEPEDRGDQFNTMFEAVTGSGELDEGTGLYAAAAGWDIIGLWAEAVRSIDGEVNGDSIREALETLEMPDDPQFPIYSGKFTRESHYFDPDPSDFVFGPVIDFRDHMFVIGEAK